jgi:hypothetical protein
VVLASEGPRFARRVLRLEPVAARLCLPLCALVGRQEVAALSLNAWLLEWRALHLGAAAALVSLDGRR